MHHYLDHSPPGRHPLPQILWDTVNKRAVHILLECILVFRLLLHFLMGLFTLIDFFAPIVFNCTLKQEYKNAFQ